MDSGAWWATVRGAAKSWDTAEAAEHTHTVGYLRTGHWVCTSKQGGQDLVFMELIF